MFFQLLAMQADCVNNRGRSGTHLSPGTHRKKRRVALLTENEVSRSWNRLFKDSNFSTDTFDSAEALLDELRPESPLRHRLGNELEELKNLHASRVEA